MSGRRCDRHSGVKKTAFPEGNRKAAMETGKLFADRDSLLSILSGEEAFCNENFCG
mgnify:CR=1 FL=1